jgi:hypothetical protein
MFSTSVNSPLQGAGPMTVCIAALCDKSQACVAAADREITVGAPTNVSFEHHESKIEIISKAVVVMSSGNALVAEDVTTRTRQTTIGAQDLDVHAAAAILRDNYLATHVERAEQLILRPRGLTLKEFKDIGARKIPLAIYQQIDQLFWNFGLNTDFLVSGVDRTGGHIAWVHYHGVQGQGWLESFDKLGYNAIGSGGIHASILLSLTGQHRELSVAETVFNVCAAKVNAEVAPGVGNQTDLTVITRDGVKFLSEEAINQLRELHKKTAARTIPLVDVEKILSEHLDEKKHERRTPNSSKAT